MMSKDKEQPKEKPLDELAELYRRLKAMAESETANEHEAAIAASKIQALLLKYNVNEAHLAAIAGDKRKDNQYTRVDSGFTGVYGDWVWQRNLMNTVANICLCKLYFYKPNQKHRFHGLFVLIGKEENIKVAQYLYEYLVREITRLARIEWKRKGQGQTTNVYARDAWGEWHHATMLNNAQTWQRHFAKGASMVVSARLWQEHASEQHDTETKALIVLTEQELQDATDRLIGNVKTKEKGTAYIRTEAFMYGQDAGEQVSWRKGLETATTEESVKLS